ncbi:Fe2+-dependent dioxygenase [Montanilutibacter psychrotolerans]|uniref:Fe2+-dependent dioxygenase n=1 Tax=Montanilutibacter psychrotolerans TaxID=1327343 RepID=A0A3M8T4E9_9GAMM|nr:Fe2+-dependent dioxygenase [Lysobacter psychrotolerans]RNF86080.1 Fe2+-dependent dioxygenase [Lysobacter psychrotolerans]
MLLQIPNVLTSDEVARCRQALDDADWADGRITAGYQSAQAKHNQQLPEDAPVAQQLGELVLSALQRSPLFMSAALPLKVFPPLFNRYDGGQSFGSHVDNAIRHVRGTPHKVRTDLSATLFLSSPDEYDGGELVIEDNYGTHSVKLPLGHLVLYPASSLHLVRPVTRGTRTASFFWVQSMVRDDGQRTLLYDLDRATQQVHRDLPDSPAAIELTGVYHNLLRRWADT